MFEVPCPGFSSHLTFFTILGLLDSAGRDLLNKEQIMGYSLAGGTYDVIQDGRQVAIVLNFSKSWNFQKRMDRQRSKPFRCVLEHAYINCIHIQLYL